jgi:predicted nucleic acid-binding protein
MPAEAFLDTNVLIYAFGLADPRKPVAEKLIIGGANVGVQTLNEFVNVAIGKLKKPWPEVLLWLRIIEKLCPPPIPVTQAIHYRGLEIAEAQGFHIYDALVLAAALEASCTVFYSEDMLDGQAIGSLTIRNPFR